jgi:Protein of unknown function (DUF2975)
MTSPPRNSMAAILSVLITIVMVVTGVLGGLFLLASGLDLGARLSGQPLRFGADFGADTLSTPELIAGLIGGLVVIMAVLYVCRQLQQILATLAAGDPFVPENAARLSRIAIAIALTEVARYAIAFVIGAAVTGARIKPGIDIIPWAAVIALFVLAQVFREGTRLRDAEKLTI